jgi:hypothetical protein
MTMKTIRKYGRAAVLLIIAGVTSTQALAQEPVQPRIAGTIGDYVWVETGAGAGAWQVTGEWYAQLTGNSGKAEFVASLLGVRSDLWVLQTGADPQNPALRSPHTHHVGLLNADVTVIPNGIRLTGPAIITTNGGTAAFSGSPIQVDITGGNVVRFSTVKLTFLGAATWATQGIVFADIRGLFRVSTERAPPERLPVEFDPAEQAADPEVLPGGRAVLYTVVPSRTNQISGPSPAGARVEVLEIETGTRKALIRGAHRARYVSTGHLIYAAGERLHAVAFDLTNLALRGKPVQVVSEPTVDFDVSDEGTLVYAAGQGAPNGTVVWVDRQGREELLGTPPRRYQYPRLSPDGMRIALDVGDADRDIWMWDIRRKTLERFTVDSSGNPLVAWSGDGQRLAFGSFRFGTSNLFIQPANGSGEAERLLVSERLQMPLSFAPDGRLLFSEEVPGQGRNIHALSLDSARRVEPLIVSAANELNAEVSPDGKWIASTPTNRGSSRCTCGPTPRSTRIAGRSQCKVEDNRCGRATAASCSTGISPGR